MAAQEVPLPHPRQGRRTKERTKETKRGAGKTGWKDARDELNASGETRR